MPFRSAINELRVLVCDADDQAAKRLADGLHDHARLVDFVRVVPNLDGPLSVLGTVEVNTIFIDPLFVQPSRIRSSVEFFSGPRERWHHYFMLSKERSDVDFTDDLFHTLHLCLADVRLMDSATRNRLAMEFVASSALNRIPSPHNKHGKQVAPSNKRQG